MKKAVLFLIICSFLTQASVKTAIFINWKINQLRITELYCINKDNPMMHCNGKCYLSQQLKKIESAYEQSKAPFNPKHVKTADFVLFFDPTSMMMVSNELPESSAFKGGIYRFRKSESPDHGFFRPPIHVSSKIASA